MGFPSSADYAMVAVEKSIDAWHAKASPECGFKWSVSGMLDPVTGAMTSLRCDSCGAHWEMSESEKAANRIERDEEIARTTVMMDSARFAAERFTERVWDILAKGWVK